MDKRDFQRALEETRKTVASFSDWFERKAAPLAKGRFPVELRTWRDELNQIRSLVDGPDRARIALVGTTGSGKSTFLNAILGQGILPVSVMAPCTAFVTAVSFASGPEYGVKVQFVTEKEWGAELETMIAVLQPGDEDHESEDRAESRRLIDAARKRIEAVYGIELSDITAPDSLLTRRLPVEVERIFRAGSAEMRTFSDSKEMLGYLRKLIRGESSLWPLVKQVNIRGPYHCLAGGIELVDLPGLNDPNEARVEVTREFLRTSPFVWVTFSMVRGLTEDIQRILREEKILRTLVFSGTYDALTLVGTKADDIDADMAEQFNLSEDCPHIELIRAYRKRTVGEARKQLEQMVRDLATGREEGETLKRMINMARKAHVHTTSANAYIKIHRISGLRKDYGIESEDDTGIPAVHKHLSEIGAKAGSGYNIRTALVRLEHLRREIEFFFRSKASVPSPDMEKARSKLQQELEGFHGEVRRMHEHANERLQSYRERFMEKLDPIFTSSVQEVSRAIEGWRVVHWATLRAIVQRNGSFKSPSTGKSYDFNADLAEPLLSQLPISWEHYFTDELGRVVDEFVVRIGESGGNFCDKARLIIQLLFNREDARMKEQLSWFREKVSFLAKEVQNNVLGTVKERRTDLAQKMPLVAKGRMDSAYEDSKGERGPGMKRRILANLEPAAIGAARPIYSTIQADLLEGLKDLELVITGMLLRMTESAVEQARRVAHNANIDVDEAGRDPVISDVLSTIPSIANQYFDKREHVDLILGGA